MIVAPFVVRVPALPASAAPLTASAEARRALTVQHRCEERSRAAAERCSEALYEVIGGLGPGPRRGWALGLRRAIHQGDAGRASRLLEKVIQELPAETRELVDAWNSARDASGAAVLAGERAWDAELRSAAKRIAGLADRPEILGELRRGKSPLRIENAAGDVDSMLSLYAFLVRGSVKTTPRGELCAWGRGWFGPGPDRWVGDVGGRRTHSELNAAITEVLLRQLGPRAPRRPNPSLAVGGTARFVAPGDSRLRRIRLPDGATDPLGDPRLVEAGMLVPAEPVSAQRFDPLRRLAGHQSAAPYRATLEELADLADAGRSPEPALDRLARELSWPDGALAGGPALFTDTVLDRGGLELHEDWLSVCGTLRDIGGWIAHADPWARVRARAAEHLRSTHGPDARIPLTDALLALRVPALAELWSDEYRMTPAADPGITGLRRLLSEAPAGTDGIRIDAIPAAPAPAGSRVSALAFYGHPVRTGGDRMFVINSVEDGCGRAAAHVRRLLRRLGSSTAEWPAPVPRPRGEVRDVELTTVAGSNVNLREIGGLPALCLSEAPTGRAIEARECVVGLHGEGLRLWHRGGPVRIVPRGRMAEFRFPPVVRMLLRLFAPPAEHRYQPALAPAGVPVGEGVLRTPRVRVGDVVLLRETSIVESDAVPRRGAGEGLFSYAARVDRWRRGCGIPSQVYLRVLGGGGEDKHRKPLPIDLTGPVGVLWLLRAVHRAGDRLLLHEVLPGHGQVPVDAARTAWMPEVVWEVEL
ncbi:hypothetical protein GWI34_00935 [Actinomadura sp. DSM 109109]|nr:hypothetical protein [Actinomadura lepetitiana]